MNRLEYFIYRRFNKNKDLLIIDVELNNQNKTNKTNPSFEGK